jgi:hypothetical protein
MSTKCEECDQEIAVKYCRACDQRICFECDVKIHNKGKRALHVRENLFQIKKAKYPTNEDRLVFSEKLTFSNEDQKISILQKLAPVEGVNEDDFKRVKGIAAQYYIEEAYKGNLMHEYEDFKETVFRKFGDNFGFKSLNELEDIFNQLKTESFIHITVRKFGDYKPLRYISLLLNSVSVEAIAWILWSIKNDRMKPTDKLVLSRLKEYFLLKVAQKDWAAAMEYFFQNPSVLNEVPHYLPKISIWDEKDLSKMAGVNSKDERELESKEEKQGSVFYFKLEGEDWPFEDILEMDELDQENWLDFKEYIDNFFGEEGVFSPSDSRSKLKKQKNTKNIQKWLSSVENDLTKPTTSLSANHSLQKILIEQSISRAIPGGTSTVNPLGKYGCALMIKLTGPPELRPLSLGKLCSYVQRALNQHILIYYKTLLIKNNKFENEKCNEACDPKNSKRVDQLKSQIISLLKENKQGLSLAQIPLMIKKKYNQSYNIQSLGFPKLKNLLVTMDEVDLEKSNGNFNRALLKTHDRKNSEKPLEEFKKEALGGRKFLTLRSKPLDNRLNNLNYQSVLNNNLQSNDSHQPTRPYRTVSSLEDYIFKVQSMIIEILRYNMFGIEVDRLKAELEKRLGASFIHKVAQVDSFQEFLISYLGDYLDIEVKKSLKSAKIAAPLSHIVYPKNYKLLNPPKDQFADQHIESQNSLFDQISQLSCPQSQGPNLQVSPDLSFMNAVKPLLTGKPSQQHNDQNYIKFSRSYNQGNNSKESDISDSFRDNWSVLNEPQQASKPTQEKKTSSEYTHFGKINVGKNARYFARESRSNNSIIHKDGGKKQGIMQDRHNLFEISNHPQNSDPHISFERDEEDMTEGEEKHMYGLKLGSKSTEKDEELSDDPSFKLVEMLLDEE